MDKLIDLIVIFILIFKIGILVYSIYKYRIFDLSLKILYFMLLLSFITDLTAYTLFWFGVKSAFMVNAYTLVEGLLLIYYYKSQGETINQNLLFLSYISVGLIEWIVFTQNNKFLDITTVFESCFLIVFSLRYFHKMLGELKVGRLRNFPFFWINCGILFYFASNLFLFAFGNLIMENSIVFLWHLHNFIQIIYLLLISIAFWKVRSIQI